MALRMMDARVWTTSLCSFSAGSLVTFLGVKNISLLTSSPELISYLASFAAVSIPLAFSVKLLLWLGRDYFDEDQKEAIPRSVFLGFVFGAGASRISFFHPPSPSGTSIALTLGFYSCALSCFHYSEFLSTAWWNPKHLSVDSFLLNHSPEYHMALGASWVEFVVEYFLVGGILGVGGHGGVLDSVFSKNFDAVAKVGLALIVAGELCRKLAMWTARSNFNHLIQWERNPEHVLVTSGIYSLSRHPSYVGWFLWSIGTQVLLKNPVCFVAYALVSWKFFDQRIHEEERTLISFFGDQYLDYQERVGTGLPGVRGLICDEKTKGYIRRKCARIRELEQAANDDDPREPL